LTSRVVLDHDFSDDILGYVSFNSGFISGGYNIISPTAPPFSPETLNAYEIGVKSELFDQRLRVNAAGFFYQFNNLQVNQIVNGSAITSNAAAAINKGLDVDFEGLPTKNLMLHGGITILNATYSSYPNAPYTPPSPTGGLIETAPPQSATGNFLDDAPSLTYNIGAQYTVPTDHGDIVGDITYSFTSHLYVAADNLFRVPSYGLLNLSLLWTEPSGRWDVRLWGKNVTGAHYYSYPAEQQAGFTVSPGAPATFGVTVGFHI
jgi:iron complex outermembrane receptor protein